nr:MAG TPA: hypothetical protein [Crassvirales sp.]
MIYLLIHLLIYFLLHLLLVLYYLYYDIICISFIAFVDLSIRLSTITLSTLHFPYQLYLLLELHTVVSFVTAYVVLLFVAIVITSSVIII